MAYEILELSTQPPLALTPTTTVFTGIARIGRTGTVVVSSTAAAEEFGFFLPDAPPLAEGEPEPRVWVEAGLTWGVPVPSNSAAFPIGIDRIGTAYLPDPRGGAVRWLNVSGTAFANRSIRIGYRVTIQRG